MQPQLQPEPLPQQPQIPEWSPALRIAFRFSVAYLGLFCVATQIITSLFSATQGADVPDPGTLWPLRPLVSWTAAHIFHVAAPLSFEGNSASGDCMFAWVLAFCLLVIAAIPHRHLVLSGPQPEKLCRAANLGSTLLSSRPCRADAQLRHGQSHPDANAVSFINKAASAFRHVLSHGGALEFHWRSPSL